MPEPTHRAVYSGIEIIEAEESTRPLIVGERTNVIGSREFKNLVAAEQWEEATEIARRQVKNGAHIVDVCLQSTDRDEIKDIPPVLRSSDPQDQSPDHDRYHRRAFDRALRSPTARARASSTRSISKMAKKNSSASARSRAPMARLLSSAASTKIRCRRKRSRASASSPLPSAPTSCLRESTKFRAENIIFDPLVFPCATGDENYIGGAIETIEGIRLIKQCIPHVRTVLGISNVSFGLPPGAREVVNSVFLYYCTKAGLDLAIVNAERIERFPSIPEQERKLAEICSSTTFPRTCRTIIPRPRSFATRPAIGARRAASRKLAINQFHIAAISAHFRGAGTRKKARPEDLPLDERLANYILEGSKDGLIEDLDRKRQRGVAPLDIINGPLMAGMAEVGRLFNDNELIVAEVLQSAEAMKTAVSHLEQFMEKADVEKRAKDHSGHGEGRRSRHRQEPRRNHFEEQWLRRDQSRHQGSARGLDPRPRASQAGRHWAFRPAGKERATDGYDRGGPARGGDSSPAAGRRRGALGEIHANEDRAAIWHRRLLRERCHDRAADDERVE